MLNYKMKVHKIYDQRFTNWATEVHDNWVYDDFVADEDYRQKWISITTVAADQKHNDIYLGIGSFAHELLWKYDRDTGDITSMNYEDIAGDYDAKLHRSIEIDDNSLYGAVALFHDVDKQFEAEGGRLFRFDIPSGGYEILDIPVNRVYVQSIAMDRERKIIYGFGAVPEVFWRYDIERKKSNFIAYLGNSVELGQAHCPVIDDQGMVWGTYGILRAFSYQSGPDSIRLFRYNPETDSMNFLDYGIPSINGDKGKIDTAINGKDGYLYFGTVGGGLFRLNPKTGNIKTLGKPCAESRLAALDIGNDGLLYGIGGDNYQVSLFRYDREQEEFIDIVPFYDRSEGVSPIKVHDMVITEDNVIYAGENDNNNRSGYLWECILE